MPAQDVVGKCATNHMALVVFGGKCKSCRIGIPESSLPVVERLERGTDVAQEDVFRGEIVTAAAGRVRAEEKVVNPS